MHSKTILAFAALVATGHAANGINQAATQLIQGYEKFAARPYNDGYGYWTVGYGHRCRPNNQQCQDVQWPLSEQAAQQLFSRDIQQYATCLTNSLSKCLNDNQYGALVSWTYNVGCGKDGMAGSTLIRRLNNGEDPNTVAGQELPRWNKAGGKVSNGLVNRRRSEVQLFQRGSNAPGNCGQGGGAGGGGGEGGGGGGGYSGYGGYSGGSNGGSYSDGGYGNSPGDYSGYSGGYGNSGGNYGGSGGGSYSGGGGYGGYSGGGGGGGGGYSGYYRKADNGAQAAAAEKPSPTDAATAPPSTSIIEDATLPASTPTSESSTTASDFTTLVEAKPTEAAPKATSSFVA